VHSKTKRDFESANFGDVSERFAAAAFHAARRSFFESRNLISLQRRACKIGKYRE
jgi:hypothetical protein